MKSLKGKILHRREGDEVKPFLGFTIGQLALSVDRGPGTIRKYEQAGIIAKSFYREGDTLARRVYTEAERDLLVAAVKAWREEYFSVPQVCPQPPRWRLGQIYWDMREKGLNKGADGYYFRLPEDYVVPEKVFNGAIETVTNYLIDTTRILREAKVSIDGIYPVFSLSSFEEVIAFIKSYGEEHGIKL